MPRVHHRKARKDWKDSFTGDAINKGEMYYTWSFRYGGTRRSVKYPKPSQLTQSEYLGTAYEIEEQFQNIEVDTQPKTLEDLQNALDDLQSQIESVTSDAESLASDTQEKLDNMPEQLQDGDVGQLLQQRVEAMEQFNNDLESIDLEHNIEEEDEKDKDKLEARIEEVMSELRSIDLEIE